MEKKQIMIGVDDFEELISENLFYVDKTLFIKEFIESKGKVTLITRPRRFGKTLNMNMLKYFFDIKKDNRALFDGLKIMEHKRIMDKYCGKHPVIYMTLKDDLGNKFKESLEEVSLLMANICQSYLFIYESDCLDKFKKELFYKFCAKEANKKELQNSLKFVAECLYIYYGKKAVILIDEYDAPLNNAVMSGYYEKMIKFMREFLGRAFKSNEFLEFGVLTGVQRISKESMVSGFNNPKICGIFEKTFATSYGFTEDEVKEICETYGYGDQFEEVEKWYNGYRFGGHDIYNPWSIVALIDSGEFRNHWANTGSMDFFKELFDKGTDTLKNEIAGLMTGIPFKMKYDERITYPVLYSNNKVFWSLLLNAGYVKPCAGSTLDKLWVELVNKEVRNIFSDCIDSWFHENQQVLKNTIEEFVGYLLKGNAEGVKTALNDELLNNPSCHDFKEENSYHMFIYGILLAVSGGYQVYSNKESGKGRYDCMIKPDDKGKHAVIIEYKHTKKKTDNLKEVAQTALIQIDNKAYVKNLQSEGYKNVYKYGIAFHKKNCEVAM